jgi:hypothetical protein
MLQEFNVQAQQARNQAGQARAIRRTVQPATNNGIF